MPDLPGPHSRFEGRPQTGLLFKLSRYDSQRIHSGRCKKFRFGVRSIRVGTRGFCFFSLLGGFGKNFALPGTALGGLGFLLIVGFPVYFFYQYGSWKKWSRNSVPNPGDRQDLVGPEAPD